MGRRKSVDICSFGERLVRKVVVHLIAVAEGGLGPNFDYLQSLVTHLDELGIQDDGMKQLHALSCEYRM